MLQFDRIKLLLLVLVTVVQSEQAFETKKMIPITINNQIGSQQIQDVITQNKLLDNVNYISDDKNEANNLFLIEPYQKSLKVFSQKSLLVEHEPMEIMEQISQQKESQDINEDNSKISIKVEQEMEKETESSNGNKQNEEFIINNNEELNPIKEDKMQNKIIKSDQKIENNNDNEIIIQDIKIEQLHQEIKSKIEEKQSDNQDVIIIKIDEEIKTTPRIFGVIDNNSIEQKKIVLKNEKDLEESEQIDVDEFNIVNSKKQNKLEQLDKQIVDKEKDKRLDEKVNKKQQSNVLNNNKKQQNDKKNKQSNFKVKSTKSKQQDGQMDSKDQKLIGELIKVQAESDDVDLSIFENDNSDLIPIIVEDSEIPQKSNTLQDVSKNEIESTEIQKEDNKKQERNDIVQNNQDQNKDQINANHQNLNVDETNFEVIQSELDQLSRELDQLSQEQETIQNENNNENQNLEEDDSNDSLQYITISTNDDPIIINSLEDDYYLDDLNNEQDLQTLQQVKEINIESKNEQEEVKVFIVNNPEQLVIQKENNNEDQFLEDDIKQKGIDTHLNEQENIISIDNKNDDQNSNQNIDKESLYLDNDNQGIDELQSENQKFKFNNYEKVQIKKNSQIKKEISVGVDNINNNQVVFNDDEFLRIASESEAEIIENLEDLQEEMQAVYQRQIKPDQIENTKKYTQNNNNKEYQQKFDQNKKQIKQEEDYLDQIRNTQIRDQNQRMKDDEFNRMINDLINEFDYKNKRERDIIDYERQITQHIIDNIEELRYAEKILQNDQNELSEEEDIFDNYGYEQYNDQTYQEAQTQLRRQEFQKECDDDQLSNQTQAISEYEDEIEKRKKEVIEKIKKELMLKKERIKNNNNNKKTDNLSTYEFERIYLDWATNKEDIVSNILLHTSNSDIEQQQMTNHIQDNKVQKISKKQEVEEEIQKLYQNYNRNGQHLRGQR